MATIITNISLALDTFLVAVGNNHITGDPLPTVGDPNLDYESAMRNYRAKNKILDESLDATRLFAFTRDPLRHSPHGPGRRTFASLEPDVSLPGSVSVIKVVFAELPIRFAFFTKNMPELEAFDLGYMAGEGVRQVKEITTSFPLFGAPLTHFVHWEPALEALELRTHEESLRQSATGSVVIQGWWFVLRDEDSPSPIIQEIHTLIQNPELIAFDTDIVVPDPS